MKPDVLLDAEDSCKDFIFDPKILSEIRHARVSDRGLVLRPLRASDYSRQYLQLLGQLTVVGDMDEPSFRRRFDVMREAETYFVLVVEDEAQEKVVASTTLCLEYKFIHSNALRGRIEDVVVDESMRGKGLGKVVVGSAVSLAQKLGCYKLSLDCRDQMIPFYQSIGFVAETGRSNMLVIRM